MLYGRTPGFPSDLALTTIEQPQMKDEDTKKYVDQL